MHAGGTDAALQAAEAAARKSVAERSLDSLDWPRVMEALVERTATRRGEELARGLQFFEEVEEARDALAELGEMLSLRQAGRSPSLGAIEDIVGSLGGAARGEILDGRALVAVAHTLEGLERLHRQLSEESEAVPRLQVWAARIQPQPDLAAWLVGSFDSRGELSSSTYPQLTRLRSQKSRLHSRIREVLESVRSEDRFEGALQDDFVAMRGDRYVVPVKVASKRAGLGIVHDASGSGQTVFVEPWEVVELNNDLKMADAELLAEERRILRDLSERVAAVGGVVGEGLRAAAHLDLVLAKAILSEDLEGQIPEVVATPTIRLKEARHPVLVLRGIDVVPNDLVLGDPQRGLVLSGPNMGGKTITLKTLGLASLLVRVGMAIPASEQSVIGWFDQVLTDIGDAQDVSEDLSTFSGHVLALVEIFQSMESRPGGNALVLLDEIAVGTDPVQGAALGRAVLGALLDRGALLATTTHYAELKALSSSDDRFVNGRVEFDEEAGRPTFRLSVGRPGSSHALDIASEVGLDPSILESARSFLGRTSVDIEEMLSGLEAEATAARRAREEAEVDRVSVARELEELREEKSRLSKQERALEQEVRAEFEREVRGYRDSVRGALKQIRDRQDEASAERARQRISEGAASVREGWNHPAVSTEGSLVGEDVQVGDRVRVPSLSKEGVVAKAPDRRGRLAVEIDGMTVQLRLAELTAPGPAASSRPGEKSRSSGGTGDKARSRGGFEGRSKAAGGAARAPASGGLEAAWRSPANTLDLRGERVDDALEKVERFLDQALLSGEPFVFLLHGHGTGALRSAIRAELKRSSYVAQWGPGSRSQGGEGISVVRLRRD